MWARRLDQRLSGRVRSTHFMDRTTRQRVPSSSRDSEESAPESGPMAQVVYERRRVVERSVPTYVPSVMSMPGYGLFPEWSC